MMVPDNMRRPSLEWRCRPGVVYLMQCNATGVCKVGATFDPTYRLSKVRTDAKAKKRDMVLVWMVMTNAIGRLESTFHKMWRRYHAEGRDWFDLPDSEIRRFRSVSVFDWKDLPPLPKDLKVILGQQKPGWPFVKMEPVPISAWDRMAGNQVLRSR